MRYACECNDPACRERLSLREDQYAALAEVGAVLSPWCALREGRPKLAYRGDAVAVATAPSVATLVARLRGA